MSAVKSRREQYSDATRAALLEAATRRFATDGFNATGLEDIAADIRATRGAVYHHFSNKKALFEAVLDQLEGVAIQRITARRAEAGDPWLGAMAALDAFLDQCLDPVYSRVVWREGPIALGWQAWQAAEQKYACGVIEEIVGDLIARGLLAPLPLGTTTRVTFWLLGSAGLELADAPPERQHPLREELGLVIRRMILGLRAD